MKLTVITPTGNRHEAFALCERWMARQTLKPFQWIVMDDGDVPTKVTMGQEYIYCPDFKGPSSLVRKIKMAVGNLLIKGDALCFFEDDDWYAPTWLEFCANQLVNYHLIGEGRAVYYNPVHRFWYEHGNMAHASLCSTAVRRNLYGALLLCCNDGNPFIDSRLWRIVESNKRVFDPNQGRRLVVGIKGMPGRVGYGSGHVVRESAAQDDQDLSKLKLLIGDDAKLYRKFGEPKTKKTVMTSFQQLIDLIHLGVNPYAGYPKEQWPVEHFGWGSTHPWFKMLIEKIKPRTIIEVGTLMGASAIHMAETLKAADLNESAIVCVDTFLAEQVLWGIPEHRARLKIQFGRPCFYYTFLSNVIDRSCQDLIVPLCMPSQSAARHLKGLSIKAQMVYIDGCHEEGDCYRDLEAYWDLLDAGGAMIIDDYEVGNPMFAGLIRDVDKFCAAKGVTREIDVQKALIWKI